MCVCVCVCARARAWGGGCNVRTSGKLDNKASNVSVPLLLYSWHFIFIIITIVTLVLLLLLLPPPPLLLLHMLLLLSHHHLLQRKPGLCIWHSDETMSWVSDELWFDSQQRLIFLYPEMSKVAYLASCFLSGYSFPEGKVVGVLSWPPTII